MNEAGFTSSINKKLPKYIHSWKINCRYANGVPDAWYSADKADLWVEYKFLKKLPKKSVKPNLSALQSKWLKDRQSEGRDVLVIVGSPEGCIVYENGEWDNHKPVTTLIPKTEVVKLIINKVSHVNTT